MDFSLSESFQSKLESIEDFLRGRVLPLEKDVFSEGFVRQENALQELRAEVKRHGFWNPHLSSEHGGAGFSLVEYALIAEVLGQSPLGHYVFNCQAPDAGNMEILLEFGSLQQKEQFLMPLIQGDIRSCFSMTEPDRAGSNPVWMDTRAELEGEHWVINGRKWFTSSAEGSAFAIVMAVTEGADRAPHERASMILVPTDTPGFHRIRNIPIAGDPGEGYSSHAEIEYHDCRVPAENLLGPRANGFRIAQRRLGPGRIHHCMRWLGICKRAFDLMCAHAASREIAPGETLADQQLVQQQVAVLRAEIHAARWSVLHAAWVLENQGHQAAREVISLIKFHVAGVLQKTLDRAIQIFGARGLTDATPLSWWWAHERGARIYDGPDEVHQLSTGRRILKRYRHARRESDQ